jgi:hypothetical protein
MPNRQTGSGNVDSLRQQVLELQDELKNLQRDQ